MTGVLLLSQNDVSAWEWSIPIRASIAHDKMNACLTMAEIATQL